MDYRQITEILVQVIEILGTAVIVVGGLVAGVRAVVGLVSHADGVYTRLRSELGRAVLLGLEILVAADIVLTVAVDLTLEGLWSLGLLVLIRTFLSFSIETEIDGVPPWRRALLGPFSAPAKPGS